MLVFFYVLKATYAKWLFLLKTGLFDISFQISSMRLKIILFSFPLLATNLIPCMMNVSYCFL